MDLEVIQHPIGSWGLRRNDGKIMLKREITACGLQTSVLTLDSQDEAEQVRQELLTLTAEQAYQQQGIF